MLNFIVRSNLFVSICATSLTWQTYILFGRSVDFIVLFTVFLSTLMVYSFHRLVKLKIIDFKGNSDLRPFPTLLVSVTLLSAALIIPTFFYLGKDEKFFMLAAGVLTAWYSLGFFRIKEKFISLRSVPFLKLFWIAFIWTAVSVYLPLIKEEFNMTYGLLLAERFFFILAITIPFDVRDMDSDRSEGLRTLPLSLGKRGALRLSLVFLAVFASVVLLTAFFEMHQPLYILALMISAIVSALMINKVRTASHPWYFTLGLEGLSLIQSLLLALTMLI